MKLATIGGLPVRTTDPDTLVRDARDFAAAKVSRGEGRMRLRGNGAAVGVCNPHDQRTFRDYLRLLRENAHASQAMEKVDALEHALKARYQIGLPVPRELQQVEGGVAIFWGPDGAGITVMANRDGLGALLGGVAGKRIRGEHRLLLDALRFQHQLQG